MWLYVLFFIRSATYTFFMAGLSLTVPGLLAVATLFAKSRNPLRRATWAMALALALSSLIAPWLGFVRGIMLVLVTAIALAIARYSERYLARAEGDGRFAVALLATMACVTTLVVSTNLAVVVLAWTGTSLFVHRLLTFFPDRIAAQIAAHKKFLVSRLADVCLIASVALLANAAKTLDIDLVARWARAQEELPASAEVATALLATAVLLKSAQLPFHGWLTQVMEAPTPVSALLHAGVVNIGGFVLIRLAPLVERAGVARGLLLVVGLATAALGALVMMTRVSVKVALAWSTVAQMGFMLVECSLGAWNLAFLHLIAHSLYKAHAFLSAGARVGEWRTSALVGSLPPVGLRELTLGIVSSSALASFSFGAVRFLGHDADDGTLWPLTLLFGLAFVWPMASAASFGLRSWSYVAGRAFAVALAYGALHALSTHLVASASSMAGWYVVAAAFTGVLAVQLVLARRPRGAFAQAVRPWLFAGFYVDETFTRFTFWVWPPKRLPSSSSGSSGRWAGEPVGAQS